MRKFLSGIDVGDVARDLGMRVRERRAALRAKKDAPAQSGSSGLQRPASRGEMITKTFAAREEVEKAEGPTTRKMESQRPIAAEKVETIATRPIETPASPKSVPPPRSSVRMMVGALAVVLAASGVWWMRAHRTTTANPVTTSTITPPTIKETTPTLPTTATVPTAPPTATTTAIASSSAGETRAMGHLALYGDPGTRVLVDGVSRGSCPLADVAVEPGEHDVRFVFDVTGDKIDTRVRVKPSEHAKLRADFTGATPTIRVQH